MGRSTECKLELAFRGQKNPPKQNNNNDNIESDLRKHKPRIDDVAGGATCRTLIRLLCG